MAHAIIVNPRARAEIRSNAEWLRQNYSAASAARWNTSIVAAIGTLANHPERCPLAEESPDLGLDLRELLHGRRRHVFRILFTIDGETVYVHSVRHASQDRLTPGDI